MSKTERKNGQRVYDAAFALAADRGGRWNAGMTTKEVAEKAGVSKPTAQKYLRVMAQNGIVVEWAFYKPMVVWRWIALEQVA